MGGRGGEGVLQSTQSVLAVFFLTELGGHGSTAFFSQVKL